MNRGKSQGHDGLSIEHLKYAGLYVNGLLAKFHRLCVRYIYLSSELMRTVAVPLGKYATGDISDKFNYRPISLATIVAKVFDSLRCVDGPTGS